MSVTSIELSREPKEATAQLQSLSRTSPLLVFKKSPTCPVSHHAEANFRKWLKNVPADREVQVVEIDVIADRALARGITAELGVQHESPQALWFAHGVLAWHDSHDRLTVQQFDALLGGVHP